MESRKDKYRGRKKSFIPVIIVVAILLIAGGFYLNSRKMEENATSKSTNLKEKPDKGKFIVYSLGNFMFGGNRNPSDKDMFVFQQTFHLKNGALDETKEISVVPFSISSVSSRNDYQPTLLTGSEQNRVKQKITKSMVPIGLFMKKMIRLRKKRTRHFLILIKGTVTAVPLTYANGSYF